MKGATKGFAARQVAVREGAGWPRWAERAVRTLLAVSARLALWPSGTHRPQRPSGAARSSPAPRPPRSTRRPCGRGRGRRTDCSGRLAHSALQRPRGGCAERRSAEHRDDERGRRKHDGQAIHGFLPCCGSARPTRMRLARFRIRGSGACARPGRRPGCHRRRRSLCRGRRPGDRAPGRRRAARSPARPGSGPSLRRP